MCSSSLSEVRAPGAWWGRGCGAQASQLCSRELAAGTARPGLEVPFVPQDLRGAPLISTARTSGGWEGGPGPSSHRHVPRTRPRQQGAGAGGERLPPMPPRKTALEPERGGPVLLAAVLGGLILLSGGPKPKVDLAGLSPCHQSWLFLGSIPFLSWDHPCPQACGPFLFRASRIGLLRL